MKTREKPKLIQFTRDPESGVDQKKFNLNLKERARKKIKPKTETQNFTCEDPKQMTNYTLET